MTILYLSLNGVDLRPPGFRQFHRSTQLRGSDAEAATLIFAERRNGENLAR